MEIVKYNVLDNFVEIEEISCEETQRLYSVWRHEPRA